MRKIEFTIPCEYDGKSVGSILSGKLEISSSLRTVLRQSDGIMIDGIPVTTRQQVKTGETLTILIGDSVSSQNIVPVDMPIKILYDDLDILAVSKPKNIPIHPSAGHHTNTLANGVMYKFRDSPFVFRPITRLDRDTTGVVLIAKNKLSAAILTQQMADKKIKKTYTALLSATPPHTNGTVCKPIGRCSDSIIKRKISKDGKPAVTHYHVIAKNSDGTCVVQLNPVTGRTHQIRVHMAHIGCPLMYDFLYGTEVEGKTFDLHCESVEFIHPFTKKEIKISDTTHRKGTPCQTFIHQQNNL
ncbi:MAG: RluA family pseudouridine synthase [Clostridia bacterium]|nr:RluA family pseudouridine synthase [Clostridia bacterium]